MEASEVMDVGITGKQRQSRGTGICYPESFVLVPERVLRRNQNLYKEILWREFPRANQNLNKGILLLIPKNTAPSHGIYCRSIVLVPE